MESASRQRDAPTAQKAARDFEQSTAAHQRGTRTPPSTAATASEISPSGITLPFPFPHGLPGLTALLQDEAVKAKAAAPIRMGPLGPRKVLVRFQYPIPAGRVRLGAYERFNKTAGEWDIDPALFSSMQSVSLPPGLQEINAATMDIRGGLTPLPIPDAMSPIPETFTFSRSGSTFDVLRDHYGQFWLRLPSVPPGVPVGSVRFSLAEASIPRPPVSPTADALQSMEDDPSRSPDTGEVIRRALQEQDLDMKISLIEKHILDTVEYSLNPDFNQGHRSRRGHLLAGIDSFRIPIAGGTYRVGHCEAIGGTYSPWLFRSAGVPAGMALGFKASSNTTELSNVMRHRWTVLIPLHAEGTMDVDPLVLDRDGEEEKYFNEEPAASFESSPLHSFEQAARAAAAEARRLQQEKERLRQETAALAKTRQDLEQQLKALLKPPEPEKPNPAKLAAKLTIDLARIHETWKKDPPTLEAARGHVLAEYTRLTAHRVPAEIQVSYLATLYELAMPFLSPKDRRELQKGYLSQLALRYSMNATYSPMVFDERALQLEVKSVTVDPNNPLWAQGISADEVPPTAEIKSWDVTGSFPHLAPSAKARSSSQVSVLNLHTPQAIVPSAGFRTPMAALLLIRRMISFTISKENRFFFLPARNAYETRSKIFKPWIQGRFLLSVALAGPGCQRRANP